MPVERRDSLYMNRVGARAFDLRAHRDQERRELADLGLARGVLDDRLALGAGRGHHEVLGARHRDRVEHEPRAFELRGARADVAVVDRDRRAHRAQPHDVQIHGPRADRATARQRDVGMPEPAEQRPEHENRRAHRLHELVRREEFLDAAMHRRSTLPSSRCSAATPMRFSSFSVVAMSFSFGTLRSVDGPVGEQRGGEDRQRGVLRAGDSNLAVERLSADDR